MQGHADTLVIHSRGLARLPSGLHRGRPASARHPPLAALNQHQPNPPPHGSRGTLNGIQLYLVVVRV
jgi:hypothetical protein